MTLHIVPTSQNTHNLKSNLRALKLRLAIWLLNQYAEQGFSLKIDQEKIKLYENGQPCTTKPFPPPTESERKALHKIYSRLYA